MPAPIAAAPVVRGDQQATAQQSQRMPKSTAASVQEEAAPSRASPDVPGPAPSSSSADVPGPAPSRLSADLAFEEGPISIVLVD